MELLIPSWAELAEWAGVFFAALALLGFGRLLSLGRATPEAALVAGWGGACFILTLWGVATASSLRLPGFAVVTLGFFGLCAPRLRLKGPAWRSVLRIGAVALPLMAVMASARPSLPDTFLNLLPNAAYLYDHAAFPADDRWPSYSLLPGAPYNMQVAAFIASLLTPNFPPSAMIGLNIILQLAFALFLARLVERREDDAASPPSWPATAFGFLLATALNPGFVPRYHFSAYSEASVTVTVGFAAWFAARALERLAARRPAGSELVLFAMTLAALVNIKQDSIALATGLVASSLTLALFHGRETRMRSVAALLAAALPAAVLYVAWRWYVLSHFAVGELKPLPFDEWQFHNIPLILFSMAGVIWQKPFFFCAVAAVIAGLVWRLRHSGRFVPATRVAALFAGVTVFYNAALLLTYIVHFPGAEGTDAHSYFRYNTHLGLLLVLSLVLLLRDVAEERRWSLSGAPRRTMTTVLLGAALFCPVIFLGFLRFDLEPPELRAWQLAALIPNRLGNDDRLALVLPGDNGSLATVLEGLIRLTPPRHPDVDLHSLSTFTPDTLDRLAAEGFRLALVSCTPQHHAVLMERDKDEWRAAAVWSYPPPVSHHWSQVVAEAPLCL